MVNSKLYYNIFFIDCHHNNVNFFHKFSKNLFSRPYFTNFLYSAKKVIIRIAIIIGNKMFERELNVNEVCEKTVSNKKSSKLKAIITSTVKTK